MKAIVKLKHKQLEGIFDVGDEVEIESILSKEDQIINNNVLITDSLTGTRILNRGIIPNTIIPKLNFIDVRIKSKNGNYYTGVNIRNAIGFIPLDKIFTKM